MCSVLEPPETSTRFHSTGEQTVDRISREFELDFDGFIESLPQPVRLDTEARAVEASCFIGILGFEPRCYTGAKELVRLGWTTQVAFCVHYSQGSMTESMIKGNEEHVDDLHSVCRELSEGRELKIIAHDDHNLATDFGNELLDAIHQTGIDTSSPATHVVFDITVGTSRLLLEGLHALLKTDVELTLVYSEASEYRPSYDEYVKAKENPIHIGRAERDFLTFGVHHIELLRRLLGRIADERPTYLIAVPSFAPTRISAVLEEISPSVVHWVFGIPHLSCNQWRVEAQKYYHKALYEPSHKRSCISTFDYRTMLSILEKTYRENRTEYNLLVGSIGSKLQKVGQVLFHILRPEVGAIVSIPIRWDPEHFSIRDSRACYAIRLGSCKKLRRDLWRTRTYRL